MTNKAHLRLPTRVAVLGAGITGLTAAWTLQRAGFAPTVFERARRVGGVVGTWRRDGWLHELGPNSLLEQSREVATLIDQLGLGARRIYAAPEARKRFVVRAGRLVALPDSPWSFLTTRLFSWRAKSRLALEPFRPRGLRDDESVAEFVARRLGREFLDYAVNPFVGGVYAGDPRRLAVRHAFPKLHALEREHGSLLRAALKLRNTTGGPKGRIFSFPGGLDELPRALAAALGDAVRLDTTVLALRRRDAKWELEFACDGLMQRAMFDVVVSAVPADALATLCFDGVGEAARLAGLAAIEQPPVVSVFTGFPRAAVAHPLDGFGVLVPEVEDGKILGALFSSTLFPGRAPRDHVAITSFVGGARQPELAGLDDAGLLRVVRGELGRLLGASAAPSFVHVQRHPRAIPQYTLGYARYKEAIAAVEISAPGLFIGGNVRDGISLASCMKSGRRLARAVIARAGSCAV